MFRYGAWWHGYWWTLGLDKGWAGLSQWSFPNWLILWSNFPIFWYIFMLTSSISFILPDSFQLRLIVALPCHWSETPPDFCRYGRAWPRGDDRTWPPSAWQSADHRTAPAFSQPPDRGLFHHTFTDIWETGRAAGSLCSHLCSFVVLYNAIMQNNQVSGPGCALYTSYRPAPCPKTFTD